MAEAINETTTDTSAAQVTEQTTVPPVEAPSPAASEPAAADPKDRRAFIKAQMERGRQEQTQASTTPQGKPAATAQQPATAPTAAVPDGAKDERPRDALGRFKALPRSWKREYAQQFESLPPEIQAEAHRAEEAAHNGIEKYRSRAQVAAEFEAALQPYLPTMQQLGVQPVQAVQALLGADHRLRYGTQQEKQAVVADIIRTYGVQFDPANMPEPSPQADASASRIAALESELRQLKQAQEQASLNPYLQQIAQFRDDPAHAHYDELETHMLSLIQTGAAKDLKDAYDQARWAHPTLRQEMLAEQRAQEQKAEQARIAAAKAAAVQVRGAPAQAMPQQVNPKDRRAVIQAALAGLQR